MNGIVACTLNEVSTKRSCVLRLYKDNKKYPPVWGETGVWEWLGGTFRPQDVFSPTVNAGRWNYWIQNRNLLINKWDESGGTITAAQICILRNVPPNFLETASGSSVNGSGEGVAMNSAINWTIWYRAWEQNVVGVPFIKTL